MTESSRSTDAPLSRAIGLARDALSATPAGLLTDFDGTLSPIVSDPGLARLVDGASGAVATLAERLAVVAVITGRAPLEARRLADIPELLVVGNHGIEWLEPGAEQPVSSPEGMAARNELSRILERVPALRGVSVEDKGLSATVHYRGADDPDRARRRVEEAIGATGDEIELRHGLMSIELRPVGLGDKGAAARAVIERFGLLGVLVMGDDLTDVDMFGAVARLRAAGSLRAAIIGVGGVDRDAPPAVVEAADVMLREPAQAALLLTALAEVG